MYPRIMHLNIETIHIAGTSLNESDSLYKTKSHNRNPKKKQLAQYRHEQIHQFQSTTKRLQKHLS